MASVHNEPPPSDAPDDRLDAIKARFADFDEEVTYQKHRWPSSDVDYEAAADMTWLLAEVVQLRGNLAAAEHRYADLADRVGDDIGILRRKHERYLDRLPIIRDVAKQYGYAIAVHGSELRDFDLIAFPWRAHMSPHVLADKIREALQATFSEDKPYPVKKPYGRLSWSIQIGGGQYIDLSVYDAWDGDGSDSAGGEAVYGTA